jgi:glycosyltransferase involved in cell wall biosynthesis
MALMDFGGLSLAFVSNALSKPDDEGVRRFAQMFPLHASSVGAQVATVKPGGSRVARVTFLSRSMIRTIRASRAKVIVYVPGQGASTLSFVRAAVLRFGTKRWTILIPLQPSRRGSLGRLLVRMLAPDAVLTPSVTLLDELSALGVRAEFLPMGVDLERFVPVSGELVKRQLRRAYGIPEEGRVVLHVGHLTHGRNLRWLETVRALTGATVVMVAGTAMGRDEEMVQLLHAIDVKLLNSYFPRIEELYQLADTYVFPVQGAEAAIAAPLSVLEAMACNLPVVTTPFGGLPRMFREEGGLFYATDADQLASLTSRALALPKSAVLTRQLALRYSWPYVVGQILNLAAGL